jgi:hypothetical protein
MSDIFKNQPPPADFISWWEPAGKDRDSGADVGGHPEAERIWARKDPGRWFHDTYGTNTRIAWNTTIFREEYLAWIEIGRPTKESFIGIAAPIAKQKEFWQGLKSILGQIGKMPKLLETIDSESPSITP